MPTPMPAPLHPPRHLPPRQPAAPRLFKRSTPGTPPGPAGWPSVLALVLALGSAALLVACGPSVGQSAGQSAGQGGASAPAVATPAAARATAVGVQVLSSQTVQLRSELPGRASAVVAAEIRPQVGGIVQARRFNGGELVRAGQVLYQIDPTTYRTAVASAEAAVARAEATAQTSRLTVQRRGELARLDAVSQQDLQDAQAALKQAEADLASARAVLDTARTNLQRTAVVSPVSGRVDVSTVTQGALVTAEQATALTTVRQVDPIQVDVTQSSAELLGLRRALAAGQLQQVSATEAQVSLLLEDGSTYAHRGRLSVAGASVNTGTGMVTLRAVFPNPEGLLLPGMYVRAQLPTAQVAQGLLVPQQAVSRDAAGQASVLLADAQDTVRQRRIRADRAVGNQWLVDQGLAAGDRVVVEGGQKVRPGDRVQVQVLAPPLAAASAPLVR